MTQDEGKREAARAALKYLRPGEPIGIGTGSTVNHFIDLLAPHKSDIPAAVSSSEASTSPARCRSTSTAPTRPTATCS